ncbi:hypothetical protein M3Y98_00622900 [Aphelenchoides besseyi]|nr:hypothetical protein M3Y98_00622900 [Aphelenchoides besseyi]
MQQTFVPLVGQLKGNCGIWAQCPPETECRAFHRYKRVPLTCFRKTFKEEDLVSVKNCFDDQTDHILWAIIAILAVLFVFTTIQWFRYWRRCNGLREKLDALEPPPKPSVSIVE